MDTYGTSEFREYLQSEMTEQIQFAVTFICLVCFDLISLFYFDANNKRKRVVKKWTLLDNTAIAVAVWIWTVITRA